MEETSKRNNILLLALVVLFWTSVSFTVPYFTPYASSHGVSATVIGIMTGLYGLAQVLLRVPIGIVSDKYHCLKLFMALGLFAQILASALCYFPYEATLFASKVLSGVCVSTWVAYTVYYIEMNKNTRSLKNTSLLNLGNNIGTLAGFLLSGILMSSIGFNALLIASCIAAAVGLLIILKLDKHDYSLEAAVKKDYFAPLKDKLVLLAAAMAGIMQMIVKGTSASFTSNYMLTLGASSFQVSLTNTILSLSACAVSMWLASKYSAKLKQTRFLYMAFMIEGLACAMTGLTSSVGVVLLMQVFFGFAQGGVFTVAMSIAVGHVPAESKTTAMGVYQSLYALGISAGPIVMGRLIDVFGGYKTPYLIMASFVVFGIALTALAHKQSPDL